MKRRLGTSARDTKGYSTRWRRRIIRMPCTAKCFLCLYPFGCVKVSKLCTFQRFKETFCAYVCECIHSYVEVHIHAQTDTHTHIHTHTHTRTHTRVYVCVCAVPLESHSSYAETRSLIGQELTNPSGLARLHLRIFTSSIYADCKHSNM